MFLRSYISGSKLTQNENKVVLNHCILETAKQVLWHTVMTKFYQGLIRLLRLKHLQRHIYIKRS